MKFFRNERRAWVLIIIFTLLACAAAIAGARELAAGLMTATIAVIGLHVVTGGSDPR